MTTLKTYDVTYAVTRNETYRIRSISEQQARQDAFTEGRLVHDGQTTNVSDIECAEVSS